MDQLLDEHQLTIKKLTNELALCKQDLKKYFDKYCALDTEYIMLQNKFNELTKQHKCVNKKTFKKILHAYTDEENGYLLKSNATVKEKAAHLGLSYYSVYEHIQVLKGNRIRLSKKLSTEQVSVVKDIDKPIVYNGVGGINETLPVLQLCTKENGCNECIFNTYCNKNYRVLSGGSVVARNYKESQELVTVRI